MESPLSSAAYGVMAPVCDLDSAFPVSTPSSIWRSTLRLQQQANSMAQPSELQRTLLGIPRSISVVLARGRALTDGFVAQIVSCNSTSLSPTPTDTPMSLV